MRIANAPQVDFECSAGTFWAQDLRAQIPLAYPANTQCIKIRKQQRASQIFCMQHKRSESSENQRQSESRERQPGKHKSG